MNEISRRDLKINFYIIEDVIDKLKEYSKALENMEIAYKRILKLLENSESKAVDEAKKIQFKLKKNIKSCSEELTDLKKIMINYNRDMQLLIKPVNKQKFVRVDRDDIYFNLQSIKNAVYSFNRGGKIEVNASSRVSCTDKTKVKLKNDNHMKVKQAYHNILPKYKKRLDQHLNNLEKINKNKVIEFENKDDEYDKKAKKLYDKYSSFYEKVYTFLKSVDDFLGDIIEGIKDGIIDVIKGITMLAYGIVKYLAGGVVLLVCKPFNCKPKWADEAFNGTNDMICSIMQDPYIIVEGLSQQVSDAYEEEGIGFCIGYTVGSVVGSVVGAKGIDKASKLAKMKLLNKSGVVDDAANVGKIVKTTDDLLKETTCSTDDLYKYLKSNDNYLKTNYAEEYLKSGKWPEDIQIPKSTDVLKADGSIDWNQAKCDGYLTEKVDVYDDLIGDYIKKDVAIKKDFTPEVGEIIDRYGPPNGRYTSPTKYGKYSYDERSLPYMEDTTKYHQYSIEKDFSNLEKEIKICTDNGIKKDIDRIVTEYYDKDYASFYENLKVYKGDIAPAFKSGGGGLQYELPLPINLLERLGFLKEIN